MKITELTRENYTQLPQRQWSEELRCNRIVLVPLDRDSSDDGFCWCHLVFCSGWEPFARSAGAVKVLFLAQFTHLRLDVLPSGLVSFYTRPGSDKLVLHCELSDQHIGFEPERE